MHSFREDLLSPTPKGSSGQPPDYAAIDREDIRQSIARGEHDEVRGAAFYNRTWIVSHRYCKLGDGVDSLEGYLHSLWYMYCQLSRHTSHETRDHDRLVLDVIRIQGFGPLTRPVSGNYGTVDIARTVDGTLWNDLPFLATDMTQSWLDDCASMSGDQRLNFSSFLAKLASTRVSKDRLFRIALLLFRATFETPRELRSSDGPDDENPKRSVDHLDVIRLLPSAFAWIKEASQNLVLLSDVHWSDCEGSIGEGGRLYVESELGRRSPMGFTPWRWMFWLKRLHEIRDEAKEGGLKGVGEVAGVAIDLMLSAVETRNSGILRAYRDGGEELRSDEHLKCLRGLGSQDGDSVGEGAE